LQWSNTPAHCQVTFLEFFEALLLCAEQWYWGLQSTQQLTALHATPAVESGQGGLRKVSWLTPLVPHICSEYTGHVKEGRSP